MCGIAGIISFNKNNVQQNLLQQMATALQHRGPNGEGIFINENNTVGFAHRRLAIIDLSPQAAQPFSYLHFTITYNGEIYNYIELKKALQLQGFVFTTQSDTEVILAAYTFWGAACTNYFDGMYAFAIYDNRQNEIFIARDKFGEKPLYYCVTPNKDSFYFASEMKALWSIGVEKKVNNTNLLNYITVGYTSNPTNANETFFENIFQLPSAHNILLKFENNNIQYSIFKTEYLYVKNNDTQQEIAHTFTALFTQSIQKRLRSDVAVGTSLSGGIDSSSIVANIHQLSQQQHYTAHCFTASFPNFNFDETQYSKEVALYCNLIQHFTTPTEIDFVNEFENLMYHQEEPVQSASIFAQYMVYKLAKQHNVTVLLDGQGADEILGGYTKYTNWYLQELLRKNLLQFKQEKALLIANNFLTNWDNKNYVAAFFPKLTAKMLQQKAIKIQQQNSFINKDFLQEYQNVKTLEKPVVNSLQDFLNYNTYTFGLPDLLRYADRNSMAHSREVRLPFLNKDLAEFIEQLPLHYKIQQGYTKYVLRKSVENILPKNIVWRKGKIGYEPPQQQWLQNAAVKEMIMNARKKLVGLKILQPSILQQPIAAKSAHDANNFDWWILCAAQII